MEDKLTSVCKKIKGFFEKITETAHKAKFTIRKSKLNAISFIQAIVLTHLQCKTLALEEYSTNYQLLTNIEISRQGFHKRINKNATDLLN